MLIRLYLDDQQRPFRELTEPSEHFELDTTNLTDGAHMLRLETVSDGKVTARREIVFTVRNGPGIALAGLREGDIVRGIVPLVGNAAGGSAGVDLRAVETRRGLPLWVGFLALAIVITTTVLAALDPFSFRHYHLEADGVKEASETPSPSSTDEDHPALVPVSLVEGRYLPLLSFDAAKADPAHGGVIYQARCAGCHGADAAGRILPKATLGQAGLYPRLARQPAAYLYRQLVSFARGLRDSAEMKPMAAALSEQERIDIAVYMSGLNAPYGQAEQLPADRRDLGRDIAANGRPERGINRCDGCHGEEGQGVAPNFPALRGQYGGYIIGQIEAWRAGARRNGLLNLMLPVAHGLTKEETQAIAAYYQNLRP